MNGHELLKKLKKLAKQKGVVCFFDKKRGKGSHATVAFGESETIMKDRTKEIGKGLLDGMCKDLGIDKDEL